MSKKNKHRLHQRHYRQMLFPRRAEMRIVPTQDAAAEQGASREVIAYQSELDYLSRCILDYPNIETGGQLFGFYAAKGTPVVCYAIGPGLRADHQTTFFYQDLHYLQTIGEILTREYGLQHIGEWHSHHQLGLDRPSGYDTQTMHHSIDGLHLGQFLLCIGTCNNQAAKVNAYTFYESDQLYYPTQWHIKAEPSPYRRTIDERLKELLVHPITSTPRLSGMQISRISVAKDVDINYLLRAYNIETQ